MKQFILITAVLATALASDGALGDRALQYGLKAVPLSPTMTTAEGEKAALGRKLFFDKNLSLERDISCASCHDVQKGGADGRQTAVGHRERENPHHLNTPTVLNTVYSKHYFWDGRTRTLAEQAKGPIQASFEMAATPELVELRVRENPAYAPMFRRIYGSAEITFPGVVEAIGSYEETLVTRSRYDAFLEGDLDAMDRREKRGLALFIDYACVACHDGAGLGGRAMRKFPLVRHPIWSMGDHAGVKALREAFDAFGRMLDEQKRYVRMEFHDDASRHAYLVKHLGTERVELLRQGFFTAEDANASYRMMTERGCASCHDRGDFRVSVEKLRETGFPFENRGEFLGSERAKRFFRVPLLRNIVRTAPYFHNGTVEKLEDAIRLMVSYQLRRKISDDEVKAMVAFFKAVDGGVR